MSKAGPWSVRTCRECGHRSVRGPAAAQYDESYAGFRTDVHFREVVEREMRERFVPRLPPGATVLDIGCGNGDFLAVAEKAALNAFGVDVSSAAVDMCRERGLSAEAGDFLTMPLPEADVVTMWDVIEHIPDPSSFFARSAQLLRPGGFLVMKTPAVTSLSFRVVSVVPRTAGALLQIPSHIEFFSEVSLRLAGRSAGLEVRELLRVGGIRERRRGGSIKKRFARSMRRWVDRFAGNSNFYVWFTKV